MMKKGHPAERSLVTPIYQSSVFGFDSLDEMIAAFDGSTSDYIYSRIANPSLAAAEQTLAEWEQAAGAVLFSSGLAASFAVFSSLLRPTDHVVVGRDLYGGTAVQLKEFLEPWGIKVSFVNLVDQPAKHLEDCCTHQTKLIFFETPTNPTMKIVDIGSVVDFAKSHQLTTVVDNTFATPINQQPLTLGVDLVTHSATKYLGGHDDVTAGVVMSRDAELLQKIKRYRTYAGAVLDPNSAFLLERGLKTLGIRMDIHNKNAAYLAEFLTGHPSVKKVYYPGLADAPNHAIARKQMNHFGGMLAFEIDSRKDAVNDFIASLRNIRLIPSLGGVETTVLVPSYSSHFFMTPKEKKEIGISDGLIRVSVGIETIESIIGEFAEALDGLGN
ncbi:MAG: aminotransferase class I/II-fold pyridoxal phosphate-dependent enzyme [Bacteroidetes bacterium]|nr:aminotransferase class I/II-fold pyridoxal phosphate-dependent enzyme [Bacteroidota bacterium]